MLFSKQTLPIDKTNLFSALFEDYIGNKEAVRSFFDFHFLAPSLEKVFEGIEINQINRSVLVEALQKQSQLVNNTSELSKKNIVSLTRKKTFTITTGHQLCLFTGPLYFIYKIASTIQACRFYKNKYSEFDFVPVYWMATEDHDFEEINHAHVFGNKITWSSNQKGSVGDFNTEELNTVISELSGILGNNEQAQALIQLFKHAYLGHYNLADATRYLVNELFGKYGIVILDGNDKALKALFKEEMRADIFENKSMPLVNQTIDEFKNKYSSQVNPREINFFYKDKGLRERIEKKNDGFVVHNTNLSFSKAELEQLIESSPEKLSPNVVTRPLYQQKILPNIAYVGGPGELSYWLQYKSMFKAFGISFPILIPRQCVLLVDKNIQSKMQKFDLTLANLFEPADDLIKKFIKSQHADINADEVKKQIDLAFKDLSTLTEKVDKTLMTSVEAEKQKTINAIQSIEQKINRALKKKEETNVDQLWAIKTKLFPNDTPQERYDNFSMYALKHGNLFIEEIIENTAYAADHFDYTILSES